MSIKELQDEELLDYLMNSDYTDDMNPNDLKYLLTKWKYYYRVSHSRNVMVNTEMISYKEKYEKSILNNSIIVKKIEKELNNYKSTLDGIKNRKLSWKERISGKIKIKENNENR